MTRWILAFDAGCTSCNDVISRVRQHAGDRLELANLADSRIREMRHRVFGDDPPWIPALFAVDDGRVRGWTGTRLSIRMMRVLGPGRSLRVAQAISDAEVVRNPQRRTALQAVPGIAAGVFLLSGGVASSVTARALGSSGTEITLLQAAMRTYGVTPSDLKVIPNSVNAAAVLQACRESAGLTTLLGRVKAKGYQVAAPQVQKVEIPVSKNPAMANPVADLTRYDLSVAGQTVGYAARISGPKGELLLAVARRSDQSAEVIFSRSASQPGSLERAVFDPAGNAVTSTTSMEVTMVPKSITCTSICGVICSGGLVGTLGECLAYCAVAGEIFCAPLCVVLVGGGCLFGCSFECCACCGDC